MNIDALGSDAGRPKERVGSDALGRPKERVGSDALGRLGLIMM
ncbi:hypothetical protein [Gleimia hominis]|nr:hypothetical protein [Gleimia hominis]WIK65339.1 hypothetical protein CJ187_004700 [Gleimia hominis]